MVDESTRLAILHTLRERGTATAAELALRLGISPAGIRYHLANLLAAGLVENSPQYPTASTQSGRGRPSRLYRLPLSRAPDNLSGLCTALLRLLSARPGAWEALANELAQATPDQSGMQWRLAFAVSQLNAMNYQAGWEAGPHGPRLRLNNCPYAAIWANTPELCRLDEALLNRLTAASARQVARTSFFGTQGPSSCLFEIREKRSRSTTLQLA